MSRQQRSWGQTANQVVDDLASRVDGQTSEVAQRAASVLAFAVRMLRWPSLLLLVAPLPLLLLTIVVALRADGIARVVGLVAALLVALISCAFGIRRHKILKAAADPRALGTELGVAVSLSERVDETRDALADIIGGSGWRIFPRLRSLWRGISMTGGWIREVAGLPRARYFVPPKIGTTVTLTLAALWMIPVSIVLAVVSAVGLLAQVF